MTDAVAPVVPVLDVRDLHVSFPAKDGDVHAVRGMSLQIAAGEIVGVVGESGSGKTVLGMTALGLLGTAPAPVTSGEVLLAGVNMLTATESELRDRRRSVVGAVFQDPMGSLNPSMRVGAQVAEAAGDEGVDVHDLLASTGIPEPEHKARAYPHELSGGLRQRVMIAMALARNPRLIVADEPTTALDVTVQATVLDLLAEAARSRGLAMLFITHDLGVAAQLCDRVCVAYSGRIVEAGPTAEVLRAPSHPYALGLLASRPPMEGAAGGGELPTLPGRPPSPRIISPGCAFAPRCPAAAEVCASPVPHNEISGHTDECHQPGILRRWPLGGPDAGVGDPILLRAPQPADAPAMVPGVPAEPAVKVHDLRCTFERPRPHPLARRPEQFVAVDNVSLMVPRGGSVAIVGESGSGKSTLLRMIVGLQTPTSGEIERGAGSPPQMIFQDAGASLTPWMPVGDQIRERLAAMRVAPEERDARLLATLDAVGLQREAASSLPRGLSGGQRQRAAIARAIAVPPALLACDEPVSALDVSLAAQVLNLLCHLRKTLGIALLFVTHDLAAARAVADDVIVMQHGTIVESGPVASVFSEPQHPYTRDLLDAVCRVDVAVPA